MTTKEKREKRCQIAEDMAKLQLRNADGSQNKENLAKFDAMDAEQQGLKDEIDREERAAALDLELRGSRRPPEGQPGGADDQKIAEEKRSKLFNRYLRFGLGNEDAQRMGCAPLTEEEKNEVRGWMGVARERGFGPPEKRDMGEGTFTLGYTNAGPLVPIGFIGKMEAALKYFGGMIEGGTDWPTASGQPIPYPTDNDTTVSGELVGEGQLVSNADVSVSEITFGAYKFSTKMVRVSFELMQDSYFDMESYLSDKFATRLGRSWNFYFTVGTGSSQPTGIVTASTVGVGGASGIAVIGDDNAASPSPSTQVGYSDMINLEHSVDRAYRPGSKYMFHDTTLRSLKLLKDKYGRPLWVPGMANNAPDTINNYPYLVNNDMAQLGPGSPATTQKTVLFGRIDKYLKRRVKDLSILRLSERFADYGQVAFIGFARADGNLLDAGTHPVKYLLNPSS